MKQADREFWRRGEGGQSMVEFVIVFPILFLLFLTILQTALVLNARHLVHYAAYYAARAAAVWQPAQVPQKTRDEKIKRAAVIACLPIAPKITGIIPAGIPASLGNTIGVLERFAIANALTAVDVKVEPTGDVTAEVTHHYAMRIPIINRIFFEMILRGKVPEDLRKALDLLGTVVQRTSVSTRLPWEALRSEIPGSAPFYPLPIKARSTLTIEREFRADPSCCNL